MLSRGALKARRPIANSDFGDQRDWAATKRGESTFHWKAYFSSRLSAPLPFHFPEGDFSLRLSFCLLWRMDVEGEGWEAMYILLGNFNFLFRQRRFNFPQDYFFVFSFILFVY